jgi:hypothetical protein
MHRERDGGAQPPPLAARSPGAGAGIQDPAVQRQSFPQPDQSAPGLGVVPGASSVVAHRYRQLRAPLDQNVDACFTRMPYHVRQPLLDHAVRGQVNAGRQVARRPGDSKPYAQPGCRDPVD